MKWPLASLVMTIILRLFCLHARAVTVTWHCLRGRTGAGTVNWNFQCPAYSLLSVTQAFEPAGKGDFPVAKPTGLESPVNAQTGMSALRGLEKPTPWFGSTSPNGRHDYYAALLPLSSRHAPPVVAHCPTCALADTDSEDGPLQIEPKAAGYSPPTSVVTAGGETLNLWTEAMCRRVRRCNIWRRTEVNVCLCAPKCLQLIGSGIAAFTALNLADFASADSLRLVRVLVI